MAASSWPDTCSGGVSLARGGCRWARRPAPTRPVVPRWGHRSALPAAFRPRLGLDGAPRPSGGSHARATQVGPAGGTL